MLPITAMMWDWKRPSFKESVTAQWSRFLLQRKGQPAPKMYRVLINTLIPLYSFRNNLKLLGSRASSTNEGQYFIVWR